MRIADARIRRVMEETGMAYLQARRHLEQRDHLRRLPPRQRKVAA